jgi:hypothetical protein
MKSYLHNVKLTKKETLQALAIGAIASAALLATLVLIPPDPSYFSGRGRVATVQEKRLMQYHGVQSTICDGTECWFYRDGKKIKM